MIAKIYSRQDFKTTAPGHRNNTSSTNSKPTEVSSRSSSEGAADAALLTDNVHDFYTTVGGLEGRLDPPPAFDNSPPSPLVLSPPSTFIEHDASLCRSDISDSSVSSMHEHAFSAEQHRENSIDSSIGDMDVVGNMLSEVNENGTPHNLNLNKHLNVDNGPSVSPPSPTPSRSTDSLSDVSLILDSLDELLVSNESDHCWLDSARRTDANNGDHISAAQDNISNHSFEVKVRLEASPNLLCFRLSSQSQLQLMLNPCV